jgi:hypothetical protein
MKYKKDISENRYIEIPFGWDSKTAKLRLTVNLNNKTIRICKKDEKGKVYQGPEPDIKYIPKIIEVLAKVYNDFNEGKIKSN